MSLFHSSASSEEFSESYRTACDSFYRISFQNFLSPPERRTLPLGYPARVIAFRSEVRIRQTTVMRRAEETRSSLFSKKLAQENLFHTTKNFFSKQKHPVLRKSCHETGYHHSTKAPLSHSERTPSSQKISKRNELPLFKKTRTKEHLPHHKKFPFEAKTPRAPKKLPRNGIPPLDKSASLLFGTPPLLKTLKTKPLTLKKGPSTKVDRPLEQNRWRRRAEKTGGRLSRGGGGGLLPSAERAPRTDAFGGLLCRRVPFSGYSWKRRGRNSCRQRRQVSHSWAVPGDS